MKENKLTLTPVQSKVFKSRKRFRVFCAGRRTGKTYLAVSELYQAAFSKPDQLCLYVAPTYGMAKQIAWDIVKNYCPMWYVESIHESNLSIKFKNGSKIVLKGADNPDAMRGLSISFLIMDEMADMKDGVWDLVLQPACADQQARVLFVGSPKGYNVFYDLYCKETEHPDRWQSFQATTEEGGNVPLEELKSAKAEMSEKQYAQEFLGSFTSLSGKVYHNFERYTHVEALKDVKSELHIGMDFNVNPMSAVVAIKVADQLHVIDEIILANSNTEEMCEVIRHRYGDRTITVYPDPAGKQRKTSAKAGVTDFTILKSYGFILRAPNRAPPIKDRVNEVNALLMNSNGDIRLWIDTKCKELIKGLDGQTFDDKTGQPDKKSGLDHATDALGYMVHVLFPIKSLRNKIAKVSGF